MGCVTCNWTPVGLTHRFMGFCMGRPWVAHGSPMVHPWVAHDGTPTDEINVSERHKKLLIKKTENVHRGWRVEDNGSYRHRKKTRR